MNKFAILVATPAVFCLADAFAHQEDKGYNIHLSLGIAAVSTVFSLAVFALGQYEQYKADRAEEARRGQAIAQMLNESFKKNIK